MFDSLKMFQKMEEQKVMVSSKNYFLVDRSIFERGEGGKSVKEVFHSLEVGLKETVQRRKPLLFLSKQRKVSERL